MLEQPREGRSPERGKGPPRRLRRAIDDAGGALPFDEFMRIALYDSEIGYYTSGRQRVGRGGDFVTSVSVGECFGILLARHFAPLLQALEDAAPGGDLMVVEFGAESGDLAADLMAAFADLLPAEVFGRLHYAAIEPFGPKREPLRQRLEELGVVRARVVASVGELERARGVLIANEVLDAMPVQRCRFSAG